MYFTIVSYVCKENRNVIFRSVISFQENHGKMWRLAFLVISAVMAGESGPEIEYPETPIEYSPLPQEEDMPSPLPGMLYPRESESREVI